jgi:hypothetical protein
LRRSEIAIANLSLQAKMAIASVLCPAGVDRNRETAGDSQDERSHYHGRGAANFITCYGPARSFPIAQSNSVAAVYGVNLVL